jgi:hypothetical protein
MSWGPLPEHAVSLPVLLRVAYHRVAAVDDVCSNHVLLASLPNGLALVECVLRNRVGVSFGFWNFSAILEFESRAASG